MGGHLGGWGNPGIGTPETSDDQHHTVEDVNQSGALPDQRLRHIHLDNRMPPEATIAGIAAGLGALREKIADVADVAETADVIETLLGEQRDPDAEIIAHANAHGWPVVHCGDGCGFTATAPDNAAGADVHTLLSTHACGNRKPLPAPSNTRLVVGCLTFIAVLIIILAFVEELAGVK